MQHRSFAALGLAAICLVGVAACGDDVLAPPDGTACTVGSIAPGDSADGQIAASSCSVWSDYNYERTLAESWTLHAKAHTGYVVRVYHREDANAVDNWQGDVWLYARNAAGDAEFATGWWDSFGTTNGNGGSNEELLFTSLKDQTVSIRVEAGTVSDTGAYTIVVESCPAVAVAGGTTSDSVEMGESCTMLSANSGSGGHVAFWTFLGDTLNTTAVTFTRTSGPATFDAYVTGEGLDFGCYSDQCTSTSVANVTGPQVLNPSLYLQGYFSAWAVTPIDTAATMKVGVVNTPITAPRPLFTAPARAGRTR